MYSDKILVLIYTFLITNDVEHFLCAYLPTIYLFKMCDVSFKYFCSSFISFLLVYSYYELSVCIYTCMDIRTDIYLDVFVVLLVYNWYMTSDMYFKCNVWLNINVYTHIHTHSLTIHLNNTKPFITQGLCFVRYMFCKYFILLLSFSFFFW